MATDAERRAAAKKAREAAQAKIRKDKGVTQAQREKQKAQSVQSSKEMLAGVLLFAIPGGGIIRVATIGGKLSAAAANKIAQLGAKRVAKPTAQQASKAKPLSEVKMPTRTRVRADRKPVKAESKPLKSERKVKPTAKPKEKPSGSGRNVSRVRADRKPVKAESKPLKSERKVKSRPGITPKKDKPGITAKKDKPGTSLVPVRKPASKAVQKKPKSEVKKPGTAVTQTRTIKDKPKGMKTVRGTDTTRKPAQVAKPAAKKKSRNPFLGPLIVAGTLGAADVARRAFTGEKGQSKAGAVTPPKSKPKKVTPPARSPKRSKSGDMSDRQKQRQVPKVAKKPKPITNRDKDGLKKRTTPPLGGVSDKRTNITAGKGVGFGPKGNQFPKDAADRKRLMDLYGGTGSAAAKAAARGTQGSLKRKKK